MSPSCGHISAVRPKAAALLSLFALLLATLPLQSGVVAGAFGAVPPPSSSNPLSSVALSFGFGPANLSPVSNGIPVYTVGDTMWAESGYNASIPLSVTSAGAKPCVACGFGGPIALPSAKIVSVKLLAQGVITPVYTFLSTDTDGVWNVTIGGLQGTIVIPVHFVNPSAHQVSLGPLLYSLKGGNMSISTQAKLGDSYDQEVCAGGNATSAGVSLTIPADMHNLGKLTLIPGSPLSMVTSGQVNESFSFWFQLFHPYSLAATSANSLVISNLMTAESQPVTFTSAGKASATLTLNMPLREGRYDLRAFFQNSTNLEVIQSRLLVMSDSSWVSLSDACQPQAVRSQDVSYSASLANGQYNWPRSLYVMYRTFGVEAVSAFPVKANLSAVNFVATPWNSPLQDFKVNVSPVAGIVQTSQEGGSLYVLTSKYPVEFNYSVDISGGHNLAQGRVNLFGRYTAQTSGLKLAKLSVHVLSDQSSPTTLQVTGPQGVSITSGIVANNQTSSFLLPTGSYAVTASQGGNAQSAQVALADGLATAVTLNFSAFLTFEVILIVTAIMAAIANVSIWILRSRSLSSRLAAK
ncbi:MAG TPA: hypothetical protein VEO75_01955 [Nitrososphaerales archaeon]|nr:hypothetical protein [Nitrososphaerales archaeon]